MKQLRCILMVILASCPSQGMQRCLPRVGSVCHAVDCIMDGVIKNAFCVVRPPGHHAEPKKAMGFCFFNNAGIGALHARENYSLEKVAVIDFDVHHGNGTQEKFHDDPSLYYASTHQGRFYPGTGHAHEKGINGNIVNVPLRAGSGSSVFRQAFASKILPSLDLFAPAFIIISAGFDAHKDDPLGELNLDAEDYYWATKKILEVAWKHCDGKVVSVLEGGYHLGALEECGAAHIKALVEGSIRPPMDSTDNLMQSIFSSLAIQDDIPLRLILSFKKQQKVIVLKNRSLKDLETMISKKFQKKFKRIANKHGVTVDDKLLQLLKNDDVIYVE